MPVPIKERDIDAIKKWGKSQYEAGLPCSLQDFYDFHKICFECHGTGCGTGFNRGIGVCSSCGGSGRTEFVLFFPDS